MGLFRRIIIWIELKLFVHAFRFRIDLLKRLLADTLVRKRLSMAAHEAPELLEPLLAALLNDAGARQLALENPRLLEDATNPAFLARMFDRENARIALQKLMQGDDRLAKLAVTPEILGRLLAQEAEHQIAPSDGRVIGDANRFGVMSQLLRFPGVVERALDDPDLFRAACAPEFVDRLICNNQAREHAMKSDLVLRSAADPDFVSRLLRINEVRDLVIADDLVLRSAADPDFVSRLLRINEVRDLVIANDLVLHSASNPDFINRLLKFHSARASALDNEDLFAEVAGNRTYRSRLERLDALRRSGPRFNSLLKDGIRREIGSLATIDDAYFTHVSHLELDPEHDRIVLLLYPFRILPVTSGGATRTLMLIDGLRKAGYKVVFITPELPIDHWVDLLAAVDGLVVLRQSSLESVNQAEEPNPFVRHFDASLHRAIEPLCHHYRPHAVIATFAHSGAALRSVPDPILRILDTIDLQHNRADVAHSQGGDLESRRCSEEEEIEALASADLLVAIQSEEARTLRAMMPEKEVVIAGHAQKVVAPFYHSPIADEGPNVMFVGNDYDPSNRGVALFLEKAWPSVRSALPTARLTLVGNICSVIPDDIDGVFKAGVVPDLDPQYQEANVVINPTLYGSGQKIKSIEAIVHGRCLVASEAGLLGLEAGAPVIQSEVEDMAAPIIELLEDPGRRRILERDAHRYGARVYSAEAAFNPLFSAMSEWSR